MKTLGIIGGLGPETTAKFYLEIVSACLKKDKSKKPPILLWNVPVPTAVEKNLIINGKGEEKFLPLLIDAAKTLEKAGSDFLVMPCNSMHVFIEEIREAVKIPVLDIVDETIRVLKTQKTKQVALLATSTTINSHLFQHKLDKNRIRCTTPNQHNQIRLSKLILHLINGRKSAKDRSQIIQIIRTTKTKTIILACTDLQLITPQIKSLKILDTMQILANAATREILKK